MTKPKQTTRQLEKAILLNEEVTSKRAAAAASKVLRDPKNTKAAKIAAGSALTQRMT